MITTEPVCMITQQRIFIISSGIPAIKPRLIPILGVAVMFGVRKIDFFPFLNRHPSKFSVGAVTKLSTADQVEEVSEKLNGRFFCR